MYPSIFDKGYIFEVIFFFTIYYPNININMIIMIFDELYKIILDD